MKYEVNSSCPICLEEHSPKQIIFDLISYKVLKCGHCNNWYNSIFGSEINRAIFFDIDYFYEVQGPAFRHIAEEGVKNASEKIYYNTLTEIKSLDKKSNSLLDVGAAFGDFVKIAKDFGWSAIGVEVSKFASELARNTRNLDVRTGDILSIDLNDKFDLVCYWDVIEHVDKVSKNITKSREILGTNKFLVIATDRYDSFLGYISLILYKISFGKFKYPVTRFYIKHNSWYPTSKRLVGMLKDSGFEIVKFYQIDYPIDKIKLSITERFLLRTLYFIGRILTSQTQMLIICRRVENV